MSRSRSDLDLEAERRLRETTAAVASWIHSQHDGALPEADVTRVVVHCILAALHEASELQLTGRTPPVGGGAEGCAGVGGTCGVGAGSGGRDGVGSAAVPEVALDGWWRHLHRCMPLVAAFTRSDAARAACLESVGQFCHVDSAGQSSPGAFYSEIAACLRTRAFPATANPRAASGTCSTAGDSAATVVVAAAGQKPQNDAAPPRSGGAAGGSGGVVGAPLHARSPGSLKHERTSGGERLSGERGRYGERRSGERLSGDSRGMSDGERTAHEDAEDAEARAKADAAMAALLAEEAEAEEEHAQHAAAAAGKKAKKKARKKKAQAHAEPRAPERPAAPSEADPALYDRPQEEPADALEPMRPPAPAREEGGSTAAHGAVATAARPIELNERPDEDDEAEGADDSCVICLDAPKTHVLVPCGHMCLCAACCDDLMGGTRQCPICRQDAVMSAHVFRS